MLIICLFLPAGAASTVSIVSLMRICSTDVAIVCAGHALGVLNNVFLSSEGIRPGTRQSINLYMLCYSFVAETAVWPNFFLMNVFFALKGSNLLLLFVITAAGCCAVWRP